VESSIVYNMTVGIARNHPSLQSENKIVCDPEHAITGRICVVVNTADLDKVLHLHRAASNLKFAHAVFGSESTCFCEASVVRRLDGVVNVAMKNTDSGEILERCVSSHQPLGSKSDVAWGDNLDLGEVTIWTGKGSSEGELILRVAVYMDTHLGADSQMLGVVEKPVFDLVREIWNDNKIEVVVDSSAEDLSTDLKAKTTNLFGQKPTNFGTACI